MADMEYENVLVDIDGAVATITLNRPEKLNALSQALRDDLEAALKALDPGDAVRVIRIKGAGRAFSAGYDITPRPRASDAPYRVVTDGSVPAAELGESPVALDRDGLRKSMERWMTMWNYRKPVIAQVHGYCLAGGGDFIGVCDIVFAASDTRFGHPPARSFGIPPTLCMWPVRIGMLKTKELLFTGDFIDGVEAERIGMVNKALPPDELDEFTMNFCRRVAHFPLDALTVHKHITNRWFEIMGVRTAAAASADYDAIYHDSSATKSFFGMSRDQGLRAALAWRDAPFGEGHGAR